MSLPPKYAWLANEPGPSMLIEALALYGTLESPGKANNPKIIAWAREIGGSVDDVYLADAIPWCGLFMAVVAKRAGKQVVKDPLWALNWGTFGVHTATAMLGDVLVFVRRAPNGKRAGHVGIYVGEDALCYHVLGGNQSDKVCITRIEKRRLYTVRRPKYNSIPPNVRKVRLSATGGVSGGEQ